MQSVYYSPEGCWKGFAAAKKLAKAAKVSDAVVKDWIGKQAIWKIYLPAPHRIPRPKFDVSVPNEVHASS